MPTSLPNTIVKELNKYRTRQGRKKADFCIIEGERCCFEALKAGAKVRYGIVSERRKADGLETDFPVYTIPDNMFRDLSMTENSQGIFYVADLPAKSVASFVDPFLLVLDGLQEPGNMGTILRTALSVGLKEVVITKGTVDPFNPKAIRSGMGAQFKLIISIYNSMADLVDSGKRVWLTTPHDGISCYSEDFELSNSIVVFGEEGNGISDFSTGEKTMIPMPGGTESLNVAQAATIYLFEGVRRGLL